MNNQVKELSTITFEIRTRPTDEGRWVGFVIKPSSGDVVIYSRECKTEEHAVMSARRALYRALGCSHDMEFGDYGWIGQSRMGKDLYGHSGKCKKCGFLDSFEVEG